MSFYRAAAKPFVDRALAAVLLTVLAPVMFVVATAIWMAMGRPVFFSQLRPGLRGKPFRLLKFRTMLLGKNSTGEPLPDAARLTRLGRFLRATSLDELPELINVLRGEMSLVGPRPLLVAYLARYTTTQARRHEVSPGITGWAQVSGRNALDWEKKFELDVWYVDNLSFWLDLKILAMTLVALVRREGIAHPGHPTMPEFLGNEGGKHC